MPTFSSSAFAWAAPAPIVAATATNSSRRRDPFRTAEIVLENIANPSSGVIRPEGVFDRCSKGLMETGPENEPPNRQKRQKAFGGFGGLAVPFS
jgi:hypothetical protein